VVTQQQDTNFRVLRFLVFGFLSAKKGIFEALPGKNAAILAAATDFYKIGNLVGKVFSPGSD
jgi:hypothetical protein